MKAFFFTSSSFIRSPFALPKSVYFCDGNVSTSNALTRNWLRVFGSFAFCVLYSCFALFRSPFRSVSVSLSYKHNARVLLLERKRETLFLSKSSLSRSVAAVAAAASAAEAAPEDRCNHHCDLSAWKWVSVMCILNARVSLRKICSSSRNEVKCIPLHEFTHTNTQNILSRLHSEIEQVSLLLTRFQNVHKS